MRNKVNLGILFIIFVAVAQSIMSALVKVISHYVGTEINVLFYYLIPLLIFVALILYKGTHKYTTKDIYFYLMRGIVSVAAVFCFFYSSSHMQLGVAALLFNTTPIFIPILAKIFLKETVSNRIYAAIIISLLGVLLILNPRMQDFNSIVSFIGIASGFLMAISQVMLRYIAQKEHSADKITFYQYFSCTAVTIIIIVVMKVMHKQVFHYHSLNGNLLNITIPLLVLGIIGFFAQRMLTRSFKYMPAAKLAPFLYLSVPISSLIGFLLWQQHISDKMLIGSIFIFIGIYFITFDKPKSVNKIPVKIQL